MPSWEDRVWHSLVRLWKLLVFVAPGTSNHNGRREQKFWSLNKHICWIYCYLSQQFKNCWPQKLQFFSFKCLFCCSLCLPLDSLFRGAASLGPPLPPLTSYVPGWSQLLVNCSRFCAFRRLVRSTHVYNQVLRTWRQTLEIWAGVLGFWDVPCQV